MSNLSVSQGAPPALKRRSKHSEFWEGGLEKLLSAPGEWFRFGPFPSTGAAASAARTAFGSNSDIERTTRYVQEDDAAYAYARFVGVVWQEEGIL